MDRGKAKQIGQRLAIKSALIGLLIAYIIFAGVMYSWDEQLLNAVLWIFNVEFWYHLLVGAVGLLVMAFIFGQLAGIEILIKRKNEILTGIKYGFLSLLLGTIIGSSVGFIQEGIHNSGGFSNPVYDYYFKPLYWVTMFGIIPVAVVGYWFGKQIKKQGIKTLN